MNTHTTASENASWISAVLSQTTVSCIEELVFRIFLSNTRGLEAFNWDAIADVLVETSFPQLRTIRFSAEIDTAYLGSVVRLDQPEVMDLIRRKLPTWAARGVLSV
jgi:hypothetical protein